MPLSATALEEGGRAVTPVLSVRSRSTSLRVNDAWRTVVRDISFDVAPRRNGCERRRIRFRQERNLVIHHVVEESGGGKLTTGRSVTRLIDPSSGQVQVDAYDVINLDQHALRKMRRSIQMVFKDPLASLNPRMTIGLAAMEPFVEHRLGTKVQARDKVAALLEKVGWSADMMKRLSYGFSAASASASRLPGR